MEDELYNSIVKAIKEGVSVGKRKTALEQSITKGVRTFKLSQLDDSRLVFVGKDPALKEASLLQVAKASEVKGIFNQLHLHTNEAANNNLVRHDGKLGKMWYAVLEKYYTGKVCNAGIKCLIQVLGERC
jgi:hypothetical protein